MEEQEPSGTVWEASGSGDSSLLRDSSATGTHIQQYDNNSHSSEDRRGHSDARLEPLPHTTAISFTDPSGSAAGWGGSSSVSTGVGLAAGVVAYSGRQEVFSPPQLPHSSTTTAAMINECDEAATRNDNTASSNVELPPLAEAWLRVPFECYAAEMRGAQSNKERAFVRLSTFIDRIDRRVVVRSSTCGGAIATAAAAVPEDSTCGGAIATAAAAVPEDSTCGGAIATAAAAVPEDSTCGGAIATAAAAVPEDSTEVIGSNEVEAAAQSQEKENEEGNSQRNRVQSNGSAASVLTFNSPLCPPSLIGSLHVDLEHFRLPTPPTITTSWDATAASHTAAGGTMQPQLNSDQLIAGSTFQDSSGDVVMYVESSTPLVPLATDHSVQNPTTRNDNTASTTRNDNTASTTRNDNTASTTRNDNTASTTRNDNTASTTRNDNTASTTRNDNTASRLAFSSHGLTTPAVKKSSALSRRATAEGFGLVPRTAEAAAVGETVAAPQLPRTRLTSETLRRFELTAKSCSSPTAAGNQPSTFTDVDVENVFNESLKNVERALEFLEKLKKRLNASEVESDKCLNRLNCRLRVLEKETDVRLCHDRPNFTFDYYTRTIDCILHEYAGRRGMLKTAAMLCNDYDLHDLVDSEVHEKAAAVIESFQRRDTQAALNFCAVHRQRLSDLESPLEAQVHLQHLLELLAQKKTREALHYVQSSLRSPELFGLCPELKQALTLLVFAEDPPVPYQHLLSTSRWNDLAVQFREASAMVFGFAKQPVIEILTAYGMSALKSKACEANLSPSCPTCSPLFQEYLKSIPTPHHQRTYLICPITGQVMTDSDPPFVSPEGHIYSTSGLMTLKTSSPDGLISCPNTGKRYPLERFQRLYIS